MNAEKYMDCERKRMIKILNFRLPHYFKAIGIIVFVGAFILMLVRLWFPDQKDLLREIARKGLVIGLLMASLARDKEEDELTALLRAQSYAIAFIVGVIYTLIMPYIDYGVSNALKPEGEVLKDLGDFQVLSFMLLIQVMFYHVLKRYR